MTGSTHGLPATCCAYTGGVSALDRAHALIEAYGELLESELPDGAEVFDAHTHLGTDIDGMIGDRAELLEINSEHRVTRSFVFCLDEPDRHPAFSAANERTLATCADSDGRLIPFLRLDLEERPLEEATRCLALGAKGIKLHPRAQKFLPGDPRLEPIFALAQERQIPILIHGGRGLPPIADELGRLVERHPPAALIIAHAGIVDLAAFARNFAGRAGVFFDSSVWSPLDLLDLYRLVPPEQIVYASDYPYGRQPNSLFMALRTVRAAGLDDDAVRMFLSGTASRIADGLAPIPPTRPVGPDEVTRPVTFGRIHQYLTMASMMLWLRQPDTFGVLGLALNACDERANGHRRETEQLRELLAAAKELWDESGALDDEEARRLAARGAFRLTHLATVLAGVGT